MAPDGFVDPRSEELLEETARHAHRLKLGLSWTDGLVGEAAKRCSRTGCAAWKAAARLPEDDEAAVAYFKTRARVRNPVVVASASNLVLVECDGPDALLDKYGIRLPETVTVASKRGRHRYLRPPPGRKPLKVQISEDGVAVSTDGYLVGAGAVHSSGHHVYRYDGGTDEVAELPVETYNLIVRLGEQTREHEHRAFVVGDGVIPVGRRRDTIFHRALERIRQGVDLADILEELQQVNATQCPPGHSLDPAQVAEQVHGAVKWARTHPTDQEILRAEARRILDERIGVRRRTSGGGLIIPLGEFLAGACDEADWLVDHLIARYLMTLVAGLPKVGKSTFMFAVIAAVTRVGEFLGLPVRGASVLLLTEEAPMTVEEKVERFGIDEERVYVLAKRRTRGALKWPRIVAEAARFCKQHPEIALVVVDTIDKFADIDAKRSESDTGVIRETIEPLYGLLSLGVAVVLITHQRKEEGSFGLRVRGGTSLTGSVDIIVEVERPPATANAPSAARVLKIVSRHADSPEEITVQLDGDKWTASGTLKAAARRWRGERVLDLLTDGFETIEEIHQRASGELSPRTLRRRLGELVEDGHVEVSGEGVKGDPCRWRLSQNHPRIRDKQKNGFGTSPAEPLNQANYS